MSTHVWRAQRERRNEKEILLPLPQSGWVSVNSRLLILWPDGKRAGRPTRRDWTRVDPGMDIEWWRGESSGGCREWEDRGYIGVGWRMKEEVRKWKEAIGQCERGKWRDRERIGESVVVRDEHWEEERDNQGVQEPQNYSCTHTHTHFCLLICLLAIFAADCSLSLVTFIIFHSLIFHALTMPSFSHHPVPPLTHVVLAINSPPVPLVLPAPTFWLSTCDPSLHCAIWHTFKYAKTKLFQGYNGFNNVIRAFGSLMSSEVKHRNLEWKTH